MNYESNDTGSEIAALRNQVFTLFLALIVVSGTLTSIVYYQCRQVGKQVVFVEQNIDNLKKNEVAIDGLIGQLVAYGQKDPNFMPILKKYGLPPAAPAPKK